MTVTRPNILSSFVLHRYFALRFFRAILAILAFCTLLVFLIDFTELLRRTASLPDVSTVTVLFLSALRAPGIMEQVFPFAVLFGAMATLFSLALRLELVVARGAGVSVWQFLLPGLVVALCLGVFATAVFNPLANKLNDFSRTLEANIFKRDVKLLTGTQSTVWLRKTTRSEDLILGAASALDQGDTLYGVVIIRQGRSGNLIQRVDADSARLTPNGWLLENATITVLKEQRRTLKTYLLNIDLSINEVRDGFSKSQLRSFWSLPELIERARAAELPTHRFSLQFNTLLAQPFFFMAMVVIAATVSLRFIRGANVGGLVLAGVTAGFVLYILRSLAEDLGNSGVVQPILAAWLPALVTLLLGFTLLLHQEDG